MRFRPLMGHSLVVRLFSNHAQINWRLFWILVAAMLGQVALLAFSAAVDDTWVLPGNGRGVLQHHGIWAIIVSDFALLLLAGYAHKSFFHLVKIMPFCDDLRERSFRMTVVRPYINWLNAQNRSKYVYIMLVLVGLFGWINNIHQTIEPLQYYGNDVFDGYKHTIGFYLNKVNLFYSWVIVYPAVIYTVVSLSVITRQMLLAAVRSNVLRFDASHPDGCYGMSIFGRFNVLLLTPYLVIYLVVYSLLTTHHNRYLSITLPLVALSVVFIAVSIATIRPISSEASKARKRAFKFLVSRWSKIDNAETPANDRVVYHLERICFSLTSASPYSSGVRLALSTIRLIPILLAIEKFVSSAYLGSSL